MTALPLNMDPLIWEYRTLGGLTIEIPGDQTQDSLGRVIDGTATARVFDPIAVHEASPHELERVPGVDHKRSSVFLYTTELVETVGAKRPSVLLYDGRRWEIVKVWDYTASGGVLRALAQLVEVTA